MAVWEDARELGRRIAGARGYFGESQEDFGTRIGRSGRTVRKIEEGELGSIGRTKEVRRRLAQEIVDAGAPGAWFDLEEAEPGVRELLAQHEAAIRLFAEHLDLQDEAELARLSADVEQLFDSSTQTSEESDLGVANG